MSLRSRKDLALELFEDYAEQRAKGSPHSTALVKVSKEAGMRPDELEKISKSERWESRYQEWMFMRSAQVVEDSKLSAPWRHLHIARAMQEKGAGSLQMLDIRTLEEARRLIQTGIEIERLILGESTHRIEIREEDMLERIQWLLSRCRALRPEIIDSEAYLLEDLTGE